jgi:methionine-rich copper-binding protein CopC
MQRFLNLSLAAALAASLPTPPAFAHAFLDHAVPGVGMTVSGPVRQLTLYYTQGVVTAFSHVHVVSAAGAQIPASKPVVASSDQQTIVVHLGRALGPGTYSVTWQVVSVDTHTTQGTFTFTVT